MIRVEIVELIRPKEEEVSLIARAKPEAKISESYRELPQQERSVEELHKKTGELEYERVDIEFKSSSIKVEKAIRLREIAKPFKEDFSPKPQRIEFEAHLQDESAKSTDRESAEREYYLTLSVAQPPERDSLPSEVVKSEHLFSPPLSREDLSEERESKDHTSKETDSEKTVGEKLSKRDIQEEVEDRPFKELPTEKTLKPEPDLPSQLVESSLEEEEIERTDTLSQKVIYEEEIESKLPREIYIEGEDKDISTIFPHQSDIGVEKPTISSLLVAPSVQSFSGEVASEGGTIVEEAASKKIFTSELKVDKREKVVSQVQEEKASDKTNLPQKTMDELKPDLPLNPPVPSTDSLPREETLSNAVSQKSIIRDEEIEKEKIKESGSSEALDSDISFVSTSSPWGANVKMLTDKERINKVIVGRKGKRKAGKKISSSQEELKPINPLDPYPSIDNISGDEDIKNTDLTLKGVVRGKEVKDDFSDIIFKSYPGEERSSEEVNKGKDKDTPPLDRTAISDSKKEGSMVDLDSKVIATTTDQLKETPYIPAGDKDFYIEDEDVSVKETDLSKIEEEKHSSQLKSAPAPIQGEKIIAETEEELRKVSPSLVEDKESLPDVALPKKDIIPPPVQDITPNSVTSSKEDLSDKELFEGSEERVEPSSTSQIDESKGEGEILNGYIEVISAKIEEIKVYPERAREKNIEGKVTLRFLINRAGEVRDIEVIVSSGHKVLDVAAILAIRRASPFPPFPAGMTREKAWVELPIIYRLK